MRFFLILLVFGLSCCAGTKNRYAAEDPGRSNSFAPYVPEEVHAPPKNRRKKKSFRERYNQTLEEEREEFEKRMKANAKRYKKMRRKMEKPQYSNPLYFGHKNKPKKRPVGKRKFCKECGIVH